MGSIVVWNPKLGVGVAEDEAYKNLKKAFILLIDWPAPKLAPVQAIMHGIQVGAQPWG